MAINESQIEEIVKQVLLNVSGTTKVKNENKAIGIFEDIEEAIDAAKIAQKKIKKMSMEQREKIITRIREKTRENAKIMSEMAVEETGMGRVDHKILKHLLVADKTPGTEDITTTAWSGDNGLTLIEMGAFGVIGGITPSTNPSCTVLCNSIGMIAGGNTVVFNPHPGAVKVSNYAVTLVNEASVECGGPENIACSVTKPTLDSGKILMTHKDIALLAVTGGPGVVTAALKSGKRALGAGAGNPPVVVDETADLQSAAKHIVDGATFDNNLPCIAEKEVVAVESIVEELKYHMINNGCYELKGSDIDKLVNTVLINNNGIIGLNRDCVGKDAKVILKKLGIEVDDSIRCIIFDADEDHILVLEELMMPILGIVKVENVDEAIKLAVRYEHGNRHSAHMHSKNIDNLTKYGREIDTAIFVKNAPSYSALGFNGEGYCTFTIASRTGEGLTSGKTFTKSRRCVLSDGLSIR
ncbi:aldehyde dehydrogenase family protein [Clostridium grantii]|uniref:Propionaldehyde dehydrogenase n=1 Tax=Clostridium grantii DSM 8605 TaxID=1121316 RepID=A0A1M5SXS2_9CLOT|nr:aldehyde dehydrogenase family protein [Clostridium grantii]SHH43068.1 propionaldehyde dehydrogenase [Clostridium grantii DSM 8605]